jgi:imidazolonepropionase-like amidohydrolase
VLAIRDAKIYTSPEVPPLEHGTVLVRNGIIEAVGPDVTLTPDAQVLGCEHCVVTAGFCERSHYFTESKWSFAAWKPADVLNSQLAEMLGSRGFTTVVDAGSDPRVTISLRRRIESGEPLGPAINTAGTAIYPPDGVPYYLKRTLALFVIWFMPQADGRNGSHAHRRAQHQQRRRSVKAVHRLVRRAWQGVTHAGGDR